MFLNTNYITINMSEVAEKIVEFLKEKKEATIKEIVDAVGSSYTYVYLTIVFELLPKGIVDRKWENGKFVYYLTEVNDNEWANEIL